MKGELLTEIWRRRAVSDTVLARTIMKAHAALVDGNPDAPLIRTVHRFGYQFVGEILDAVASPTIGQAAAEWSAES